MASWTLSMGVSDTTYAGRATTSLSTTSRFKHASSLDLLVYSHWQAISQVMKESSREKKKMAFWATICSSFLKVAWENSFVAFIFALNVHYFLHASRWSYFVAFAPSSHTSRTSPTWFATSSGTWALLPTISQRSMGIRGTCLCRSIALTHHLKDCSKPWVGVKQSPLVFVDDGLAYLLHVKLQFFLNDFIISGAHFIKGFDLIIGTKNLLTTTLMSPHFVSRLLTDRSAPPSSLWHARCWARLVKKATSLWPIPLIASVLVCMKLWQQCFSLSR